MLCTCVSDFFFYFFHILYAIITLRHVVIIRFRMNINHDTLSNIVSDECNIINSSIMITRHRNVLNYIIFIIDIIIYFSH